MPSAAPPPPASFDRFEGAIRSFRSRLPMTDPEFRHLEEEEREKAFWVAGVTQGRLVQEVFSAVDRAIVDGKTLADFKDEVGQQLADSWGGEDPVRLETVFRTNLLGAYNAGRFEIINDPVVKDARPYWRFDAVGDARDCPICEPLNGIVLPADDPFWKTHHPSLHHQCRCVVTPLDPEEAREEGITKDVPKHELPADGFGRPPGKGDPEPNLDGFDPDIRRILKERLERKPGSPAAPPPAPAPPPPPKPKYVPPVEHEVEIPENRQVADLHGDKAIGHKAPAVADMGTRFSESVNPGSYGVKSFVPNARLPRGVAGMFQLGGLNRVSLDARSTADLADALRHKSLAGGARFHGVKVLFHELLHAASSNSRYSTVAERSIEESTTEALAHMHTHEFARRQLGVNTDGLPSLYTGKLIGSLKERESDGRKFLSADLSLTAYAGEVKRLVEIALYSEGADASINPVAAHRAVSRYAFSIKRRTQDDREAYMAEKALAQQDGYRDLPEKRRRELAVEGRDVVDDYMAGKIPLERLHGRLAGMVKSSVEETP